MRKLAYCAGLVLAFSAGAQDKPFALKLNHLLVAEARPDEIGTVALQTYMTGVRDAWLFAVEVELEAQLQEPERLRTAAEIDHAMRVLECGKRMTNGRLYDLALAAAPRTPDVALAAFLHSTLSNTCGRVD